MQLNKNQAYIKVNETLSLNVVKDEKISKEINYDYSASNFTWTSTNEDVATVDSNGIVTGKADGYTTIYAYNKNADKYAMCIVNVAKKIANPQIETGNGYTALLKADGTVWTIGNNVSGELGDGTTENSNKMKQVYIDSDTPLSNIIKISSGTDHILALTKDGNVYAWGLNDNGQLGQNNTTNLSYAKLVLDSTGENYLSNIVDISAGAYNSMAVDKDGNAYVWGKGSEGELGNETTTGSNLPVKVDDVDKVISCSVGNGSIGALTSSGILWTWGQDTSGELGINSSTNTSWPMKSALNVTDISLGGYHTTIKKTDGKIYATGNYTYGRTATGSTVNDTTFKLVNLPSNVTDTNKVKYIKSGITNTTILLQDGTIWETGFNLNGELGNGTNTNQTSFVQGKLSSDKNLENVLTIGKNNGNVSGTETTGYGLNTAVITTDGEIYTTGSNTYGQIGDNSNKDTSYYKNYGYSYIDYADKTVELKTGKKYTIDKNKINLISSSINAYNNEKTFSIGDLEYTVSDTNKLAINGNELTALDAGSGLVTVKIEDKTNNYTTHFNVIVNRLINTDTILYIYNAQDLVEFRDKVNGGDDFKGKTVYVMADIDLSEVCSEEKGSWTPIGTETTNFAGTFDGNFHKIDNIYINSTSNNQGLFGINKGIIQNIIVNSGTIKGGNQTGGVTGSNYNIINNCENKANITANCQVGGITGVTSNGQINNCCNLGDILGTTRDYWNETFTGGIIGYLEPGTVSNCYNEGNVRSVYNFTGGIVGGLTYASGSYKYIINCYNIGTVSGNNTVGSLIADGTWCTVVKNSYFTTSNGYCGNTGNGSPQVSNVSKVSSDTLKTYASTLGTAYEDDTFNINEGYPILWWQAPTLELNKKQVYIKTNENIQLNLIESTDFTNAIGKELAMTDLTWTSSNENVATVDSNGLVTGKSDGYATIYGYYETGKLYAMCKVNVSSDIANPQIETGEGFTAILKPDGTVWTIGKNEDGQLGDGTNVDKKEAVQVKIDENTYLTNIVKISVGQNHVMALTKDGEVYAWGANTFGQLGQNNTESLNYAKKVLGEGGDNSLQNIIDISAGSYGSMAINEYGWVYVWGNNTYGEVNNREYAKVPEKNVINTAISVSMGAGHVTSLSQSGKLFTWGLNSYGQLGNKSTTNSSSVQEVATGVLDVSAAGNETILQNASGEIKATGLNTCSQLGTGDKVNKTTFTNVILPKTDGKITFIKAGQNSTMIQYSDNSVYLTGNNTNGELGDGTSTASDTFVEPMTIDDDTKELKKLENISVIGRSSGTKTTIDNVLITTDGRVYTTGNNTYGQIGDNTNINKDEFTSMGYIKVEYPEEIIIEKDKSKTFDALSYIKKYFNIYKEEIYTQSLTNNASIFNTDIAVYKDGLIIGRRIGTTMLVVSNSDLDIEIDIPVKVVSENGKVVADTQSGNKFTVSLKSDGTVWSYGQNTNGELGIGNNQNKNLPTKVSVTKDVEVEAKDEKTGETLIDETTGKAVMTTEKEEQTVKQISVGDNHVVALTTNGEIFTWGLNTNGQLGNGSNASKNTPVKIDIEVDDELQPVKEKFIKVVANKNTTYAITQTGKVYAWGENYSNVPKLLELYTNSETTSDTTSTTTSDSTSSSTSASSTKAETKQYENVMDISKNYYLNKEGIVKKLSDNSEIKLSYNETKETGEKVIQTEKVVQMSEGVNHLVLLGDGGNVYTYGTNTYGQLGDGTTVSQNSNITTAARIIKEQTTRTETDSNDVSEKDENNTTTSENTLDENTTNESSENTTNTSISSTENESKGSSESTTTSASEKLSNIISISAGDGYTTAVDKDGNMYVFGKNENGELAINPDVSAGGKQDSFYALKVEGLNNIIFADAGMSNVSAVINNGDVYTFGNGEQGQLGNGESVNYYTPQAVGKNIIQSNTNEILLEEGEKANLESTIKYFNLFKDKDINLTNTVLNESIATIDSDGVVTGVKQGRTTIVVKENNTDKIGVVSVRILAKGSRPEGSTLNIEPQIATSGSHTITLKTDGTVWSYGQNTYGELGIGTTENTDVPTKAKFPDETIITKIATGEEHSLALDSDGYVWVWGRNSYGQLGETTESYLTTPTKLTTINNIKDIECGKYNSFVITNENEVYSFGFNSNGECGIGSYTNKVGITKVKNLSDVIDIKAGKNHTLALRSNGEVYVTGSNLYGELGQGTYNTRRTNTFINVTKLNNIISIASGDSSNIALNTQGGVYVWGSNIYGELGIGDNIISTPTPTKVNNISNICYIEAGKNTSSLLDSDGNVYVSGLNKLGSLGNGTNTNQNAFAKIDSINNVIDISQGDNYIVYLKQDGTVFANGDYNQGYANLKSKTKSYTPIQVGNDDEGFSENEILVNVGSTKDLTKEFLDAFNLIYDESKIDNLSYKMLNKEIATVKDGIVTGVRTGTTRVIITDKVTSKKFSIKVNVVENGYNVSPKVDAGENFATVLKADGTIYTFGYNGNGALSDGTYITKDIPTKTNVIATYKDISVGKDFIVALRNNNTVWTVGANKFGQLGIGSTRNTNTLSQISQINDAEKIAAGSHHAIVLDSYGIVYGWGSNSNGQLGTKNVGNNILKPVQIANLNERIADISAGENQTVLLTSSGKVYGMGDILNGYLSGIENAVKVEVGSGYLLILTTDGEIYKYDGTLNKIQVTIDQTSNESSNENATNEVNETSNNTNETTNETNEISNDTNETTNEENVSGETNEIKVIDIKVKGNVNMYQTSNEKVYTFGDDTYGQLGDNQTIKTTIPKQVNLHGDNTYTIGAGYNNSYIIENTGLIYASGDNEYGELGNSSRTQSKEHTLVGDRKFSIEPETKIMTINDKETPTINSETFSVFKSGNKDASEFTWNSDNVDVVYASNGTLTAYNEGTAKITVTDKVTGEAKEIERYVQDIDRQRIEYIEVNDKTAEPSGYNDASQNIMTYKVQAETDENNVALEVKTKDSTDVISLNKEDWTTNVGTGILAIPVEVASKNSEIPIYIKTSNGTILTYMLTIEKISKDVGIKEITLTCGEDLTNPEKTIKATPISSTEYEAVVTKNTTVTLTKVITNNQYAYVSIDGKQYTLNEQTKNIVLGNEFPKEVSIVVKAENGKEQEYKLTIYNDDEIGNLESLTVNDKQATKVSEGKYAVTLYKKTTTENTSNSESTTTNSGNSTDTNIASNTAGTITNNEVTVKATAISSLTNVSIEDNDYKIHENEDAITLENSPQEVNIKVKTQSGEIKEYTLEITVKEKDDDSNLGLDMLIVNGNTISVNSDGTYKAFLPSAETTATVKAIALDSSKYVQIATNEKALGESEVEVEINNNENTFTIKVMDDDGNEKSYTLIISKAESDTSIKEIKVQNNDFIKNAINKGNNIYEVKIPNTLTEVDVSAITEYSNAKVKIANGEYSENKATKTITLTDTNASSSSTTSETSSNSTGTENTETSNSITVSTSDDTTTVLITVQSENGQNETTYTLNIIKQSKNTNLKNVTVGGINATWNETNNEYVAQLTDALTNASVTAETESEFANVKIDTNSFEQNKTSQNVVIDSKETIVSITVEAEDGTTKIYKLKITGLPDNTNIAKVEVNGRI